MIVAGLLAHSPNSYGQCTGVDITFPAPYNDTLFICHDSPMIDLMQYASTATGLFSGSGIVGGTSFDPIGLGGGHYDVTYTDGANTCSKTVTVVEFAFSGADPDTLVCKDSPSVFLQNFTEPDGGTYWNGPIQILDGSGNAILYPTVLGTGTHQIEYRLGTVSCIREFVVSSVVLIIPDNDIASAPCINDEPYNLVTVSTMEPSFGNGFYLSGPGISGSIFDPAAAGPGEHQIYFSNGVDSCSDVINVLPILTEANILPADTVNICTNALPFTIMGNGPTELAGSFTINSDTSFAGNNFGFEPAEYDTGTYMIEYLYIDVEGSGCPSFDTLFVNVNDLTVDIINNQGTFCESDGPFLVNVSPPGGVLYADDASVQFFDAQTIDIANTPPGTYWLYYDYSDIDVGCFGSDSLQIEITTGQDVSFAVIPSDCITEPDKVIYTGTEITDTSNALVWSINEYELTEGMGDTMLVTWTYPGTYEISLSLADGSCIANGDSLTQVIPSRTQDDCGALAYIPNVFTPNGDDVNDLFLIMGDAVVEMTLHIYDRWGEKVFETSDQLEGWNGTFKDEQLPPGVFFYYVELLLDDGSTTIQKGNVTLIR